MEKFVNITRKHLIEVNNSRQSSPLSSVDIKEETPFWLPTLKEQQRLSNLHIAL
jgi:hypothetical protein